MTNTSKKKGERPTPLPDGIALPHEQEIEKAILAGLMASNRHMPTLAAQLLPEMFTLPEAALAFEAYLNIYNRGESADALSLEKELRRIAPDKETLPADLYRLALGGQYLETGDGHMPTHARHVREAYVARQLMLGCYESTLKAARHDRDTKALLKELDALVGRLAEQLSHATSCVGMKEATPLAKERMQEILRRVAEGHTAGIHTGLAELDRMTGGMMPGTLNVIAARPRVGKTAFALFMALNAARDGHPVCLYSLEMSMEQLMFRLMGCIADIEPSKIQKGTLSATETERILKASEELERLPIWIDERTDLGIADLRYQISLRRRQGRCDMVVVDYLQLMLPPSEERKNTNDQISAITRQLKLIAKENDIPVVLLSQLNRNCEARPTLKNMLSDLRDSGSIEQDADLVLFLRRLSVMNIDEDPETRLSTEGRGSVSIAKNRHGEPGEVRFVHNPGVTRFADDRTPLPPRAHRPAKQELDKDLFG
ncbi:replicative DNA helicase [Parabacteroides sp.]